MRPAKILFVISGLSVGGAERAVVELSGALAENGFSVAVLTLTNRERDHYVLDPRVVRLGINILWDSKSIWQSLVSTLKRMRLMRDAIREYDPDVVISFIEQTNVRVLAATIGSGYPVVVSERVDPRFHWVGRSWVCARKWLYPLARSVVVQTESVAEWARKVVGEGKVCIIPNFVRILPPPSGERTGRIVLAVGRLDKQKGFDLLLRAFAVSNLPEEGFKLIILGDGSEREALWSLSRSLGIEGLLSMPGVVEEPEYWMARCSIFVLPSRYEGFPNVLLEAMAMGCAVVATDCPSGPGEIVEHGKNGLLVSVDDADELAEAMNLLAENEALRLALGNRAAVLRERYSKDRILRRWLDLVDEVVRIRA